MTTAIITIMLKPEILDAPGQAIERALSAQEGAQSIERVRVGKHIEVDLPDDLSDPQAEAEHIAEHFLVNPMLETFAVTIKDGS